MSLYHLIEDIETADLDCLTELIGDLVSARRAVENAEQDARYEVSAEVRANHYGAHADELTAGLAKELARLFPALAEPTQLRSAA